MGRTKRNNRYDGLTGESEDPRYVSVQRLMKCKSSLVKIRQFLWDEIGMKSLYRGDGRTMMDDGKLGVCEYLARNMMLADIDGLATLQMDPRD